MAIGIGVSRRKIGSYLSGSVASIQRCHFPKVGDIVNLECDIIGKYVEKLLQPAAAEEAMETKKESGITEDFLKKYGF